MTDDRTVALIDAEHNEVTMLTWAEAYAYGMYAQGLKRKSMVKSSDRPYWSVVDPDPIELPFGLWDQAEARHAGQTPVKKVMSRDERLKAVMRIRYEGHREIRRNWHERNESDGITARFVSVDEPWKPMEKIIVTSGKKLMMPYA